MQLRLSAVERSWTLFDGCEESAGFDNLLISIRKVPANDDAGLTAANDPPGIKLKLEDPSHVGWQMMVRSIVVMVVACGLSSWCSCSDNRLRRNQCKWL